MFARKSSSHNLLFRKPISRSVTAPRIIIATIKEEDDEPSVSASAPVLTRPAPVEDEVEEAAGGLKWFRAMPRRQKLIVAILCLANFSATVFYSCIAPFFPSYAEKRGVSETEVGLIFGCFQLVIFIMSPIWGAWMTRIGSKFLFVTGILTCGTAAIIMGFLEFSPPGRAFMVLCFIIRVVDALGVSAFMTASFTIIASEFPHAISTIFGACETFNGLGYTLGPPIGGFLFQLGGFILPFGLLGGLVCICGIAAWILFPSFEDSNEATDDPPSYRKYFSIPGVWVSLIAVFTATLGLGFLDAMYGPHLEAFGISPGVVGAIFLLPSVLYFICAPFLGVFIDRKGRSLEFMVIGAIISGSCYLFMGPAPFLNMQGALWVLIIANIILGLGTCGQLIPPFGKNLEVTINAGFPDNFETHGMVSGALSSATALGAFVGPSAGGFAVERFGFSWTVTGVALIQLLVVSLAVADVLLLLSSVPETIASYFRPAHVWMLGRIGCRTLIFLQYLGINSSSASLLAFSLERYFAVCRPRLMDYQVNTRKAQRMIAVIWLGTTFYCSPWFWLTETASMGFELQGYEHLERCTFRLSRDQYAYLFVGDLILFYVLPLFVCGWLYAKMGLVLYKSTIPCRDRQEMEVVESPSEMVNLTGRCSIDSDKARKVIRSRIQVVRMLALVVFLFAVLSAPYRGLMVYNCFAAIPWFNKWYLLFAKTSVYLNSAINPVLYNSMNSRFRMAFRSMLSCEKVKK